MTQKLTFSWICCKIYNVIIYCDNDDQIFIARLYCNMLIKRFVKIHLNADKLSKDKLLEDKRLLYEFIEQTMKESGI